MQKIKSALLCFAVILFMIISCDGFGVRAEDAIQEDASNNEASAVQYWHRVVGRGFGDVQNNILAPLIEFQGQLYVGATNDIAGCQIWRSRDGRKWENVVGPKAKTQAGFSNKNNQSVNKFIVFGDWLFAGLWNEVDSAQLWRSADGVNWEAVVGGNSQTKNGFGKLENSGITALGVFKNMLFAGTGSLYCKDGVELWLSKDHGITWKPVAGERFALFTASARESKYFLDMIVFQDVLYIATGDQRTGGSEIWRSRDGLSWEAVVGVPSAYRAGMGNFNHDMIYDLKVFKGRLYAAVYNYAKDGGALWRSIDGRTWEVIVGDAGALYPAGFGESANFGLVSLVSFQNHLYLGTVNEEGSQLWVSDDGLKWQRSIGPGCDIASGFGNTDNRTIVSLLEFKNNLYAGTHNIKDGGELWRLSNKP